MKICVGHLYPDYLNIYADRGNIAVLARRVAWRGHELEVRGVSVGEELRPAEHDLLYVGGGQDREQALVANDLVEKRDAVREALAGGAALLAVCGGYQLLGRSYRDFHGVDLPGVGIFPLETVAGDRRMIGDVLLECELEPGRKRTLAGFENHAGRTRLDPGAEPLGRVIAGFGNDGESGHEGCRVGRAIGTYLHGPLLPRNPWLADWLLAQALARRLGEAPALDPPRRNPRRPILGSPERAEVDGRVARLPATQEPLDRRMQHDDVEIGDSEQAVPADGCVLRCHAFERAPTEIAREDDVDDVLRREAAYRRDRVDDRDGPLDRQLVVDPDLLRQLAVEGVDEALARVHTATREQPVLLPALLVTTEKDASPPAQDRRDTDPRLSWHHDADEPKPRTPRSVAGSSSTSIGSGSATGMTTSCAIRIPGSTTKAWSLSVFSRTTRSSPQ